MAQQVDSLELGQFGLSSGEARTLELQVPLEQLRFGGQTYAPGGTADALLSISRTTTGHALRLRFGVDLHGPCTRCLEDADAQIAVDAREVDEPGEDEELHSPYVTEDVVDLHAWARDALVLALPAQIVCSEDCRGLCAVCGADLNRDPEHAHEPEPDPRWAKLSELKLD